MEGAQENEFSGTLESNLKRAKAVGTPPFNVKERWALAVLFALPRHFPHVHAPAGSAEFFQRT